MEKNLPVPIKKIFVCIPTYNERENISLLIKKIFSLRFPFPVQLFLVVVDDNSPDGTGEVLDKLAKHYPLKVIHRPKKMGLGSAYQQAFCYALTQGADAIFEMDADFSHNPNDLPRFLFAWLSGYDLVLGSRRIPGGAIKDWNFWRHFCSSGAMFFSRLVLSLKTKDVTTGFRCFSAPALKKILNYPIKGNGYAFQEEMVFYTEREGFAVKEIPIIFEDRRLGKSKLSWRDIREFFWRMAVLKIQYGFKKPRS